MIQQLPTTPAPEPSDLDEKLDAATKMVREKKANNVTVLDLRSVTSFADYFLICSGNSTRQVQAIADAVMEKLRELGARPLHVEGYDVAAWTLIDFGDLIVHIFNESARSFYDLERLWRDAKKIEVPE
jgi:ribosome-associated protein